MQEFIMALDQGTTSSRAILFDKNGQECFMVQKPVQAFYTNENWVEQNANEIYSSIQSCIVEILVNNEIDPRQIKAVGITNQRETTIIWNKKTGKPVYNAVVWQSRQSQKYCDQIKQDQMEDIIRLKTGLVNDPYFSATKIKWIIDSSEEISKMANNDELMFGTVDSWLIYKLSNHQDHVTDMSNASRTMLLNIETGQWDQELLAYFNIKESLLPKIVSSGGEIAKIHPQNFLGHEVEIKAVLGDQQAALFGQTCFEVGQAKNTYGTGCFMLMNVGNKVVHSKLGLLSTIAWQIDNTITYALEGSVLVAGSGIAWLRDSMRLIKQSSDSESYAFKAKEDQLYVILSFYGLGTPYWNSEVKGAVLGLTSETTKEDFIRASLEGICYQVYDVLKAMQQETNITLKSLNVDGGASLNNYLMQFQSDILNTTVQTCQTKETTAQGVAYLAGLECGFYESKAKLQAMHKIKKTYQPQFDDQKIEKKIKGWQKAINASMVYQ